MARTMHTIIGGRRTPVPAEKITPAGGKVDIPWFEGRTRYVEVVQLPIRGTSRKVAVVWYSSPLCAHVLGWALA